MTTQLSVQDMTIELTRKNIKNINLRVTQPEGQVRVSAPRKMPIDIIYAFVVSKYDWIKKHQEKLKTHVNLTYENGEFHSYLGREYKLQIVKTHTKEKVVLDENILALHMRESSSYEKRQSVLDTWFRQQLKNQIPVFINKYEQQMDLQVKQFGVKKMKTRWGTCNPNAKRIWLNLELVKKPIECLEYVVLHEMTHFLEAKHNQRFYNFVAEYMPDWKTAEEKLLLA
ncbi:MAG: M48 family metallopeptidase [Gammaproteobacteria bacterium]